jgi:hypothetical protein
LFDGLDLNFQLDLIADQDAAAFEGGVPVQAEVTSVELRLAGEAGDGLSVGRDADAVEGHVERNFAGLIADGQVADELELVAGALNTGALEGDRRELLDVEEVGRTQVSITPVVGGVDAGRIDLDLNGRQSGVLAVVKDGTGDAGKAALDGRDHHVADAELDQAVGGIDLPGGMGQDGGGGGGGHE